MRKTLYLPVAACLCLTLAPAWAMAQVPPPPPSAPAPDPEPDKPAPAPPEPVEPDMSEEEKLEKAKGLYIEAEGQFAEENYVEATKNYEQAYYLVPGKHGFAHKVGVSSFKAGDCNKSEEYLQHFLRHNGDPDKYAEKIDEAKIILGEISASGCATREPEPATGPAAQVDTGEDAPDLTSRRSERTAANAEAARERDKSTVGPLMATGIALTAIGGAALITGGITLGLASSNASQLNELSSNSTQTGFPEGDYSDSSVFQMDRQLDTYNALTITGFAVGGVLAGTGIALIVVDSMRKKKMKSQDGASEPAPETARIEAIGPALFPGGGGAAASVRF